MFVTGGVEQYDGFSFDWVGVSEPIVGRRALNLYAGDYSVIVTDSIGCETTVDFTITEPPALIFTEIGSHSAYCREFDFQSGNGVVFAA